LRANTPSATLSNQLITFISQAKARISDNELEAYYLNNIEPHEEELSYETLRNCIVYNLPGKLQNILDSKDYALKEIFEKQGFEEKRKEFMKHMMMVNGSVLSCGKDQAAILMGDFNDVPDSPVVRFIEESGFAHVGSEYTTMKRRNGELIRREIDYIFFKGCDAPAMDLVSSGEQAEDGFPTETWPSDHLMLHATFLIN